MSSTGLILADGSGLNVLALIMIFLWVPETKQRTLEELDYICKSSASRYLNIVRLKLDM